MAICIVVGGSAISSDLFNKYKFFSDSKERNKKMSHGHCVDRMTQASLSSGRYVPTYTKGSFKKKLAKDLSNDAFAMFSFFYFFFFIFFFLFFFIKKHML